MSDKQYNIVNDTAYDSRTPSDLVALLERLRQSRERCVFVYGNPETCIPWDDRERGRIGRSCGTYKIPLLVKTSRSMGGGALLDYCIIQVRESKGGRILYNRVRGKNVCERGAYLVREWEETAHTD